MSAEAMSRTEPKSSSTQMFAPSPPFGYGAVDGNHHHTLHPHHARVSYRNILTRRSRAFSGVSSSDGSDASSATPLGRSPPLKISPILSRRLRSPSLGTTSESSIQLDIPNNSPPHQRNSRKLLTDDTIALEKTVEAQRTNDSMVYLDGPHVYSCGHCRTDLTSHDAIISKSFRGRHGRAYLLDHCVNITIGPAEDRVLMTGLHSVCDIFCGRCKNMVGWTYQKAYEASQKYKEGKFIVEKINLHMEHNEYYEISPPAGEVVDKWRQRSIRWGKDEAAGAAERMVYEYLPPCGTDASL